MSVRPVLRRVAAVVTGATVTLAAGPLAGTALAAAPAVAANGQSPANGSSVQPPATVSVCYTAPIADVSSITVTAAGGAPVVGLSDVANCGTGTDNKLVFTPDDPLAQASYNVSALAFDRALPVDSSQTSWSFSVDTTLPTTPHTLTMTNPVHSGNRTAVAVSGKTEPNAAVSVTVSDGATPASTATGSGTANGTGDFTISGINVSALADGPLTASVTAKDAATNTSPAATVGSVKDTAGPVLGATTPAAAARVQPRSTVLATYDEALGSAVITVVNKVGTAVVGATGVSGSTATFTMSSGQFSELASPYTVTAVAKDAHAQSTTSAFSFTIDATAPLAPHSLTFTNPVNAANQAAAQVGGVAEPGSTVEISIDDTTDAAPVTATALADATSGAFTASAINLTTLGQDALTATVRARDAALNLGPAATVGSTKDSIRPAVASATMTAPINNANKAAVAVSGDAEPGSTVHISVDDATPGAPVVTSTTADSAGAYSKTLDVSDLANGTVTASVTAEDAAGNVTATPVTASATKDAAVPATPTVAFTPALVNDANKGAVTISGVTKPNAAVSVTVSDADAGTADVTSSDTADAQGAYATPALALGGLADGPITATVTATDAVGNTSAAGTGETSKDVVAPGAPTVALAEYATSNSLPVSGTAAPGSLVTVTVSGGATTLAPVVTTAGDTGDWATTADITTLPQGIVTATAKAADPNGNVSAASDAATTTKDTIDPVVASATLTDPMTPSNVTAVVVSGTVSEGGSAVRATLSDADGATAAVVGDAVATGAGAYTITVDASSLTDGTITASVVAVDVAGNDGAAVTDTATKNTLPLALVSTSPADAATVRPPATVTGVFNEPLNTATSTITVKDVTETVVGGALTFSADKKTVVFTPTNELTDAASPYTVAYDAYDPIGEHVTDSRTFTVDGTAPATPSVQMTNPVNLANRAAVVVSGTAEQGSSVLVSVAHKTVAGDAIEQTVTATDGTYTATFDTTALPDGSIEAAVVATDAAGNPSLPGKATSLKDTEAPADPTVALTDPVNAANAAAVTVSGTAPVASTLAYAVKNKAGGPELTGTAPVSDAGAWSVTLDLSSLGDGTIVASATAADAVGNTSAAISDEAAKDTVVPDAPGVGLSDPVNAANATTVEVSGPAESGTTVTVTVDDADDATAALTKEVTATGTPGSYTASFDVTSLADGTLTAVATAKDGAGNVSAAGSGTAVKDSAIPDVPALTAPAAVTRATAAAAPFSGTAEKGTTVTVTVNDTDDATDAVSGTTTAGDDGTWSRSLDLSSLKDGNLSIAVTAADTAGNVSGTKAGTVAKDVTRAFTFEVSGTPVSGAAQAVTVTAHSTYDPASAIDATYTGTPALTSTDGHFTAGTCSAAVAGVASCSGVVFGDLGSQTLTASEGSGNDLVTGAKQVVVQATGLTFTVAPPATAEPNQPVTFTVAPTAGVDGASIAGYAQQRTLSTTGASSPASGSVLACDSATCQVSVTFLDRGAKSIKVTDNGTPSRSTTTAAVNIPYGTALTLVRSAITVNAGSSVTLSGKLTNTTTLKGVASQQLAIYRKTAPGTTLKPYTTVTTRSDGTWTKTVPISRNTSYQVRYAGNPTHLAAVSPERLVKAAQVVTVAWSSTGGALVAKGSVSPSAVSRTVYLQYKKKDGTWAYAGAKSAVSSTNGYKLGRTFSTGKYVLRTAIAATSVNAAGYSSTFTFTVR